MRVETHDFWSPEIAESQEIVSIFWKPLTMMVVVYPPYVIFFQADFSKDPIKNNVMSYWEPRS